MTSHAQGTVGPDDDDAVTISTDKPLRLSPDAMRGLKKATGRSMSELLNDEDDEANRLQVLAFAELHRRGVRMGHLDDAGTLWDRAGDMEIQFVAPEALDPTAGASSITSPPSADIGE